MKLLFDESCPKSAAERLRELGHDAVHTSEINLSGAPDPDVIARALADKRVLITLDADFHSLLALSGASAPTTIRIRAERLKGADCAELVARVTAACAADIDLGAAISVDLQRVRVRLLPLKRK